MSAQNPRLVIVPTANLALLVYRAVARKRLPYNYVVGWFDVSGGIGLHLGNVTWTTSPYVNEHWRR